MESLYLEFVNRVNEVGVEINHVLSFPYNAPLLQFVCGLGPRKAAQLIKVFYLKEDHDDYIFGMMILYTDCQRKTNYVQIFCHSYMY